MKLHSKYLFHDLCLLLLMYAMKSTTPPYRFIYSTFLL